MPHIVLVINTFMSAIAGSQGFLKQTQNSVHFVHTVVSVLTPCKNCQ